MPRMSARRNWPWDGLCLGVLAVLYGLTVSRDLGSIDSGELAAVCATLGIAHPTGYPLYSLVGKAFLTAWPGSVIHGMNMLSAVFALAASALLLRETRFWTRRLSEGTGGRRGEGVTGKARPRAAATRGGATRKPGDAATKPQGATRNSSPAATSRGGAVEFVDRNLIALESWLPRFLAVAFGLSGLLWSQATTNEVYSLHAVLAVAIMGAALRLASGDLADRTLFFMAYALGLAGAHHLSIVFLGPAVVMVLVYAIRVWPGDRVRSFAGALLCLVLGFSVVLYLPVRSGAEPVLDWGDPEGWATFKRHLLAAQYSVWHFQSSARFVENLTGYFARLPMELGFAFVALVPAGIYFARSMWRPLTVLLLVALTTLVWASGYEIFDLEPYYLPADIAFLFLAGAGLHGILRQAGQAGKVGQAGHAGHAGRTGQAWRWAGAICVAVTLVQGLLRYPEQDRSGDRFVRFHLEESLADTPPDAIVLSAFWDAFVSPSIYVQEVERTRRDLTIVDPELLRRSWYFEQLRRWDPELLRPLEPLVDEFLVHLAAFEAGQPYDPQRIESRYRAVIEEIAHTHRPERPTVFTADVTPEFARNLTPVPEGLIYVLREDPATSPKLEPPSADALVDAGFDPDDRIHQYVLEFWVRMVRNRVAYLNAFGRDAERSAWEAELTKLSTLASS